MTASSRTLQIALDLIQQPSITPFDSQCQHYIASLLESLGFTSTHLRFDDVDNLWAVHGESGPIFCFAGHTDVVPTGDPAHWKTPPFTPTISDGTLYGRGAADMKGSIASMICACEQFLTENPNHSGRIAFLITSDEEGIALNGTRKVVEWLEAQNTKIDWCLVGEPSSSERLGDTVKNGRRGSLGASLLIKGVQGHVAYPQRADNPIHRALPALADLASQTWDNGNQYFPPTSFQISNIHAGTGATNVIPGDLRVECNFRFSTETSADQLKSRVESLLNQYQLNYQIDWHLSGQPFLTQHGALLPAIQDAIREICGYETELSTAGGTSDGRFIAPTGAEVVELGPENATIHKVNEGVKVAHLEQLTLVYQRILEKLLGS